MKAERACLALSAWTVASMVLFDGTWGREIYNDGGGGSLNLGHLV